VLLGVSRFFQMGLGMHGVLTFMGKDGVFFPLLPVSSGMIKLMTFSGLVWLRWVCIPKPFIPHPFSLNISSPALLPEQERGC
jgi:hypothetical protein